MRAWCYFPPELKNPSGCTTPLTLLPLHSAFCMHMNLINFQCCGEGNHNSPPALPTLMETRELEQEMSTNPSWSAGEGREAHMVCLVCGRRPSASLQSHCQAGILGQDLYWCNTGIQRGLAPKPTRTSLATKGAHLTHLISRHSRWFLPGFSFSKRGSEGWSHVHTLSVGTGNHSGITLGYCSCYQFWE